jgi:two-component system nitrate/nitrite response regulator NarL
MFEAIAAPARAITVLVADCHPLYRDAVARVVRQHRRLSLVAEVEDSLAVGAEIARIAPSVAVVDPDMPGLDCDRLIARLVREQVPTRLLLIGSRLAQGDAYAALARGAAGCLSRQTTAQQLAEAIQSVAAGKAVIAPELQTDLAAQIRIREHLAAPPISPREREILQLMADGLTAPQMGRHLHLSTGTVKTHMLHVYEKLEVSERAAAVAQAMRRGLLE